MSAFEYMPTMDGCWWPAVTVLVDPDFYLPRSAPVVHGDPAAQRLAAAERVRQWREGDAFVGPDRVPEVIARSVDMSEGPGTLPRLGRLASKRGWRVEVTHGRGWGLSHGMPGARLLDSYALRLRGIDEHGRDVRMFGLWVNGQAQYGGVLVVGGVPEQINITRLGELINSVKLR